MCAGHQHGRFSATTRVRSTSSNSSRGLLTGVRSYPQPESLVGTSGIGELVAVAVDLEDVPEWVLAVDHPVRLLAGVVVPHGHPLLASRFDDALRESFDVGVLDAEVEHACFPVLEIAPRRLGSAELEKLDSDPLGRREVSDVEADEVRSEHVPTHDADRAVVLHDFRR